ncbi:hypothetical protein GCM10010123_39880 [Pilimelia anulata]|uniref:DUF11 domain-containing protein n=1 Tax=Pilimelia anulata TaxID=53371 RepID=A0A8J3B9Q8_9ACTN|nr:hypothetical protein [Pilimelia anulata]GGK05937.1 hypothetical protein GCM10010123_39880 [Pilimelia anulata]
MRTPPIGHALILLGLIATVIGPVTASAAPTQAEVHISVGAAAVAPGAPARRARVTVDTRGRFVTLDRAVVTFDLRRAAGLVRIAAADDDWHSCTAAGTRLVCALPPDWDLYGEGDVLPRVTLTALPGARVGAVGSITTTLADPRIGSVTTGSKVRVVEHVDLVAGADEEVRAAPDSGFVRALEVRNNGRKPVDGVVARFDGSYNVDSAETDFRNCRYDADGYLLSCVFPTELAPGRAYRTEVPMWVDGNAHAPGRQLSRVTWQTLDEAADDLTPRADVRLGGGAELTLAAVRGGPPARRGDTAVPGNVSRVFVAVTGRHAADVAVVGSAVRGRAGDAVELTTTLANHGPADLETLDEDTAVAAVDITLPPGVTVVEEPDAFCDPPRGRTYRCYSSEAVLAAGDIEEIVFTVRIDRVEPGAAGRAELVTDDADLVLGEDGDAINNAGVLAIAE